MYITQDIANRIKARLKIQNINMKTMLSDLDMGINSISEFSKGKQMSCISLAHIADYLDCSVDYLLGRTDLPEINRSPSYSYDNIEDINPPMVAKDSINYGASDSPIIPVLGYVAAGEPILSYENTLTSIQPENDKASYALITDGNSMEPVIKDGEIIEVISQQNLETGEIGIVKVDNATTCKRFYEFDDHYELRSLNSDFDIISVPKSPDHIVRIIGKVSLTDVQKTRYDLLF